MLDLLRRYFLAVACLFGPVLLVYCGTDVAVSLLVRQERTEQLPAGLAYKLLDTKDAEGRLAAPPGAGKPAEKSEDEKRAEADLKRTDLYARHIAGRYSFSVGVGFVFFAAAVAFFFAGIAIYHRAGLIGHRTGLIGRRAAGFIGCGAAVIIAGGLAGYVGSNQVAFPYARPLVMDWIFAAADRHDDLKLLMTGGTPTAEAVNHLMRIGTFVGVGAVVLLMVVFCLAAVRPQKPTLEDLRQRLREIRLALVLASTILVLYVLVSKLLLQWPLSLLADAQRPAFQKIADAVLLHWSATATIILLMISLPAAFAWWLDVEAYRRAQPQAAPAADDGLRFAPLPAVTSVIVALAPLIASPLADTLKAVITALPVK